MGEHRGHLDITGIDATGPDSRYRVPVHVQHLGDDALTWVDFEFAGEKHRMSVAGTAAPYDVLFTEEFGRQSPPRFATFPIAAVDDGTNGQHIENQLRPQLVAIHQRLLDRTARERHRRLAYVGA